MKEASAGAIKRGTVAQARGLMAEQLACDALTQDGWTVLGRRMRTPAGEIDIVASHAGLLAFVEVKARPAHGQAAWALSARQKTRLIAAAEVLLAAHPDWGTGWAAAGIRFDVMLVDAAGQIRRVADAFRID